ncbi:hypothetical protein C5167_001084 [Papaver somniferum]|uniref:Uncharacterized protein n=1 Tax=Papaver somniferum TaxID=3469 RepID=A0A4Y7KYD7_PAPSO|nr:hypothetical protein C5167_001084 [Papaver somniferum]
MVDELCKRRFISRVPLKQIRQKRRIINGSSIGRTEDELGVSAAVAKNKYLRWLIMEEMMPEHGGVVLDLKLRLQNMGGDC